MTFRPRKSNDNCVICVSFADMDGYQPPKNWLRKENGKSLPRREFQYNEMLSRLAKRVQVSTHQLPPLVDGSRILLPTSKFPNGAFVLRFETRKQAEKIRQMLEENGVSPLQFKTMMVKVESSGWSVRLTAQAINEHLRATVMQHRLRGMTCTHVLKGFRGVAQFMVPSYH